VNKSILSKTRNPLLPDTMLSQGAYDAILEVDPTYFGLDAKGVEQQRQNIRKNIPLGLGTAPATPMAQTPIPRSMPMNMPSIEKPEQDSTNFLGSLLAQGTAMLGAGIQGGDVGQVGRSFEYGRQRAEQDRKAKALVDPKSEESKRRRMVFEKALGSSIPEEYSATDLNDPVVLQSIRDKKMQEMAPKGNVVSGVRGGGVAQAKPEKEKKNPFQKEINQINIAADNGLQALDELEKLIQQKGTTEFFGSTETKINQLTSDIAKAKTRILDPNSVISPLEAQAVKEDLGLGGMGRYITSDKTALDGIQSFKKLLQNNKNNALKAYYNLPRDLDFNEKDQFILDQYRNNPDDPDIQDTYKNMMKSKGL
jgi:hypothetical protein